MREQMNKREAAWVERLRNTMAAKPDSLALYVTGDTILVFDYALVEDGADQHSDEDFASIYVHGMEAGDFA